MKNIFKYLLLFISIFVIGGMSTKAATYQMTDIISGLEATDTYAECNEDEEGSIVYDDTLGTLTISCGGEESVVFDVDSEYGNNNNEIFISYEHEFEDGFAVSVWNNTSDVTFVQTWVDALVETIGVLKGQTSEVAKSVFESDNLLYATLKLDGISYPNTEFLAQEDETTYSFAINVNRFNLNYENLRTITDVEATISSKSRNKLILNISNNLDETTENDTNTTYLVYDYDSEDETMSAYTYIGVYNENIIKELEDNVEYNLVLKALGRNAFSDPITITRPNTFTVDDLIEILQNNSNLEELNENYEGEGSFIEVENSNENLKVTYHMDQDVVNDFINEEGVLSLDKDYEIETLEDFGELLVDYIIYEAIINSVATLHGYTDEQIKDILESEEFLQTTLATHGIELTSITSEEGESISFKIDLNNFSFDTENLTYLIPTFTVNTENSFSARIRTSLESEEDLTCEIYKYNITNMEEEQIDELTEDDYDYVGEVDCNNAEGFLDDELLPGREYQYIVKVNDRKRYSTAERVETTEYTVQESEVHFTHPRFVYDGEEHILYDLYVEVNGMELDEDDDYEVSYSNNVFPGTATVTLTFTNGYTGTITKNFQINSLNITKVYLSKTTFTYNGKYQYLNPKVYSNNELLTSNDYSSNYLAVKNAGVYKVVVQGTGYFNGTITKTITVKPTAPAFTKAKIKSNKISLKWNKKTTNEVTGYQIRVSKKKSMSKAKTYTVAYSVGSKKIKKLANTNYVQIRSYKVSNGTTIYSSWSSKKKVQ